MEKNVKRKRYIILDTLRGLTLISMILYHAMWDMVYMFGADIPWYKTNVGYVWQQSICWTFILLSGFCWHFGRNKLKRGLQVYGCSWVITIVTVAFMPGNAVWFGVLGLLGSAMVILIPLDKILHKISPYIGMTGSFLLFLLTKQINIGTLGLEGLAEWTLPKGLYQNYLTAYIGFPPSYFYSTDYFSLIPWLFLFITGYFVYKVFEKRDWLTKLPDVQIAPLSWLGKHSLIIYMLHQPLVYVCLWLNC